MNLRIWHNSNFGHEPFVKSVKDIQEAITILDIIADYDLYLDDKIDCNAQGLEVWNPTDMEWEEWMDDEGKNIEAYR